MSHRGLSHQSQAEPWLHTHLRFHQCWLAAFDSKAVYCERGREERERGGEREREERGREERERGGERGGEGEGVAIDTSVKLLRLTEILPEQ